MGIHLCANVVCEPEGSGAAVLLRAVEPREGLEVMRRNRPGRTERDLTNGPAKLTQAFGIRLEHDRDSVLRGSLRVEAGHARPAKIARSPRIGLTKGADLWQRFFVVDNRWVTPSPVNRHACRIRPIMGRLWAWQTRAAR